MRFVPVKSAQAQARSMLFRTRALLMQQRTQTVNALRGHLAEFGLVAARGVTNVERLWEAFARSAATLPEQVVPTAGLLFDRIAELNAQLGELDKKMRSIAKEHEELRRLMTIPGVKEITAMAVIRHARRRKEIADPWLRRMLAEKPTRLVAVALANKMARIIWALMVKGESYRAPSAVGAADDPTRVRAGRGTK